MARIGCGPAAFAPSNYVPFQPAPPVIRQRVGRPRRSAEGVWQDAGPTPGRPPPQGARALPDAWAGRSRKCHQPRRTAAINEIAPATPRPIFAPPAAGWRFNRQIALTRGSPSQDVAAGGPDRSSPRSGTRRRIDVPRFRRFLRSRAGPSLRSSSSRPGPRGHPRRRGVLDLGVQLRADQDGDPGQVEPEQQHHDAANRAVGPRCSWRSWYVEFNTSDAPPTGVARIRSRRDPTQSCSASGAK